jgi:LmbE family N-acetylglucosaminyl deacetylase
MKDNGHILAFMAHPDDIEILCAGTLIHLRERGYTIHMATMTAGDGGSAEMPGEEISRVRLKEARASADLLNATYHCAGLKDFLISYEPGSIRKVVEVVRICQAFLVITHRPSDYMLDHEVTSQLVRNACFCAGAPNMKTEALPAAAPLPGIPYLYYAAPIENKNIWGDPAQFEITVDITDVMALKEKLLKCHASQREWVMKHHGIDEFVESARRWSAEVGRPSGVAYAEGFQQHVGHAYPQDDKLSQILADKSSRRDSV